MRVRQWHHVFMAVECVGMHREKNPLARYAKYGCFGGLAVGVLLATMMVGPYLRSWSLFDVGTAAVCIAAFCALAGYVFFPVVIGSLVRGAGFGGGSGDSFGAPGISGYDACDHHHHDAGGHNYYGP